MAKINRCDFVDNELGQSIGDDLPNSVRYELEGADVYLNETDGEVTIVIAPMAGLSQVISLA